MVQYFIVYKESACKSYRVQLDGASIVSVPSVVPFYVVLGLLKFSYDSRRTKAVSS